MPSFIAIEITKQGLLLEKKSGTWLLPLRYVKPYEDELRTRQECGWKTLAVAHFKRNNDDSLHFHSLSL